MLVPFIFIALYFSVTICSRVDSPEHDHPDHHDVQLQDQQVHLAQPRRDSYPQIHFAFDTAVDASQSNKGDSEDQHGTSKNVSRKYVFMHHIVGNTYEYTYNSWLSDFREMEDAGIDAVALNIGGDSWQFNQLKSAYDAATQTPDIKLFISFDYTAFPCSVPTTVDYVNYFKSHPSQFNFHNKPMISSYSGVCLGIDGWKQVHNETSGHLMPFIYGEEYENLRTGKEFGFFDSWYCWGCAWPQGNYSKNTDDDHYYMDILGTRYATTVSGWFYAHYPYKNFYLRGDDWLLNGRWEQLFEMRDSLIFVEMVTWNDFGESDYFGPLTRGLQPDGTTWADGFPHTAWLDMSKYYITAFKTGTWPEITEDAVYYWCRPHLRNVVASNDALDRPRGWDWTSDDLWAAVFCTSVCDVELWVGNYTQTFAGLEYGVSKIKMPLKDVGPVGIRMYKHFNGGMGMPPQVVVEHSTRGDFEVRNWTEKYNYNVYVGKATPE